MPWVRFDDATADHPKFSALEDYAPACGWLWFSACCYCMRYLTDGRIDLPSLRRLWPWKHVGVATGGIGDGDGGMLAEFGEDLTVELLIQHLVEVRLLEEIEPGLYRVHDFLKYNPSRRDVLRARKENSKRQEDFRKRKRNGVTNNVTNALVIPPPSPSPTPTTKAVNPKDIFDGLTLEQRKAIARTQAETLAAKLTHRSDGDRPA